MAADEQKTQKAKSSRSARLGDRVFFWVQEGEELKPRVALLTEYAEFSKSWSLLVISGGVLIPYPGVNWSDKPKSFHWTFADQVEPIPVE